MYTVTWMWSRNESEAAGMLSTAGVSLLELIEPSSNLVSWYFQLLVLAFFINAFLPLASNDTLRYYGCYVCYIFTTMALSVLYIPVLLFRPRDPRNIALTNPFAVQISKAVGIQWELRGKEVLAEDRAAVVTMNHQSMFDILAIGVIAPTMEKCVPVARKEVFYYWPFGLGAWLCGVVFIDRLNAKSANRKLESAARFVHKNKTKMIMFPEGTRNRNGKTLLPFKKGAFRVAIETQCPVIPVVFSPYYFINSEKKYFEKGRIIIKALPAIPTTGMELNDVDLLTENVRIAMETEYQGLRREVEEGWLEISKCR